MILKIKNHGRVEFIRWHEGWNCDERIKHKLNDIILHIIVDKECRWKPHVKTYARNIQTSYVPNPKYFEKVYDKIVITISQTRGSSKNTHRNLQLWWRQ